MVSYLRIMQLYHHFARNARMNRRLAARLVDAADSFLSLMVTRHAEMTRICLTSCLYNGVTSAAFANLTKSCRHLIHIEMWPAVTDALVVQLAEGCPSLEHVDLFGCTNITDKAVTALARRCSWLKYLNLSNSRVTDKGIAALGKGCPGLVELIVEGCDVSEGPAIDEMRAAGCRVLVSLAVSVHTRNYI